MDEERQSRGRVHLLTRMDFRQFHATFRRGGSRVTLTLNSDVKLDHLVAADALSKAAFRVMDSQ